MKKRLIIFALIVFVIGSGFLIVDYLLSSIGGFTNTHKVITRPLNSESELIEITINQDAEFPHAMDLSMQGKTNGTGILQYGWSYSDFYRTDTISNSFLIDYHRIDWYNDTVIIKYTPITATKGQLNVDCTIYSSKKRTNATN